MRQHNIYIRYRRVAVVLMAVLMAGGTAMAQTTTIGGSVYGGGALANTGNTEVNLTGGVIEGDVYGGGMGDADTEATVGSTQVKLNGTVTAVDNGNGRTTDQYLDDCVVKGKIFGCNNINGTPLGNATVHIYKTQGYEGHQRTAADKLDNIDNKQHSYELFAVYGGGNLAAYEPENPENCKATVIIDGCDLTSIQTVYGGGNAASTPATQVEVNGTYEIGEVFGGGNGLDALPDGKPNPGANVGYKNYTIYEENGDQWIAKDDPAYDTKEERTGSAIVYGTGEAKVDIFGGRVHRVFGGSNTKGNVRVTAVTMLEDEGACHFLVDEAYGGGKSAPMDGDAQLLMSCIPGLKAAYGGAEAANIEGDVVLNITNGNFDRVFGGNNVSGTIGGTITVNIEETGCKPVIIGQLYGGGNQAAYTAPFKTDPETGENLTEREHGPTLNVRSFTSIGEIYGGGYGKTAIVIGDTYVNINVCDGQDFSSDVTKTAIITNNTDKERDFSFSEYVRTDDGGFEYEDDGETKKTTVQPVKVYMPARKGLVGAINNVFGGGNAAKVEGDTYVNIGTEETTDFATGLDGATPETGVVVKGADIRGNVYGGGNNAEVTGDTHVVIGEKYETPSTPTPDPSPTPEP